MNPKVSVIVPVYGAEAFLPTCISSLRAQTLRDIELIFVCTELNEEVKHFVHDFKRTCARTVDLIDDNDRLFAKTKRLL